MGTADRKKYNQFCKRVYVPIYSKSWWMDAVCLPENWDVWLYEKEGDICAVMLIIRNKEENTDISQKHH